MKTLFLLATIGLLLTAGCNPAENITETETDFYPMQFDAENYPLIPNYMSKPMYTDPYWFLNPIQRHFKIKYKSEDDN